MIVIKINYSSVSPVVNVNYDESPIYVKVMYGGAADGITEWGEIIGTLSNQTDLQNALNAKYDDPTGTTAQYIRGDGSLATFPTIPGGTVTSVGLSMPSAFSVSNSPITSSGTIAVAGAGTTAQYVRGDGSLATFPVIQTADKLITEVYNNSGATLTKGTVVYINGAQGNLPTVTKAIATGDATSAQTFGLVQTDITNMNNGYVVVMGKLGDLDTQAIAEGSQLYLSSTTAGAYTTTKQYAPNHLVYVGVVVRSHPTQGVIEVRIQNGYELDEIHDVSAQTPSNNDGLFFESSSNLWKNKSISTILGYTPEQPLTFNAPLSRSINAVSIPVATGLVNGYLSSGDWTNFTAAYNDKINSAAVTGTTTKTLTLNQQDGGTITASWTDYDTAPVTSVFGRTGAVVATSGDYTTDQVTEGTNLYFTDARARAAISLTTTGTSGAATYISGVINVPNYTLSGLGGVPSTRTLTINGTAFDLSADRSWSVGTVTSVAALTLGTTGTDLSSSVATGTTTPVITLNVPTASATNRGALSSADWSTFNNKQNTLTLTTTGTSGAATLVGATLNIPQYQEVLTNPITGTGTTNYLPKFTGASTIGNSLIYDNGTFVGIGTGGLSIGTDFVSIYYNTSTTRNQAINIKDTNVSGNGSIFLVVRKSDDTYLGVLRRNGTDDAMLVAGNSYLALGSVNTETARITSGGNLLVGTTTDSGYKLDVNGTLSIAKFNANATSGGYITLQKQGSDQLYLGSSTAISGIGTNIDFWATTGYGLAFYTNAIQRLTIASTGAATFSSSVTAGGNISTTSGTIFAKSSGTESSGYQLSAVTMGYDATANYGWITAGGAASRTNLVLQAGGGNVGIGVTPSAWRSSQKVLQIGNSSFTNYADVLTSVGINYYIDASNVIRYINNVEATNYYQIYGQHVWLTAPSGTAGNAITFTQAMTLDAIGNLMVGIATADSYSGNRGSNNITLSGSSNPTTAYPSYTLRNSDGSAKSYWWLDRNIGSLIGTSTNHYFGFFTNNIERARITIGGNLLVGTTTDGGQKLQVSGTSYFSGNVGIGTASPGEVLDVHAARGAIRAFSTTGTNTSYFQANNTGGVLNIGIDSSTGGSLFGVGGYTAGIWHSGAYPLSFGTSNTERMRITSGGNLLVGTTTDGGYKLDVNGTARVQGDFTLSDTRNIIVGTTTGTKIGTATSQKLAFWNATPIVQPTTAIAEAAFVENSGGTAVNVDSTFAGYTLQQIAQALKDMGILA